MGLNIPETYVRAFRYYSGSTSAISHWPLAFLLTSFFYCLPLGRYSVGAFDTDFRLYDLAIFFVFGYYWMNGLVVNEINRIIHVKTFFTRWLKFLIALVVLGVIVALLYSGYEFMMPRLIRLYRFLAYLSVPFLVMAVVRTRAQYFSLLNLLFFLICLTGCIAFLQGLNYLPNFWPDYWRDMYSENDAPVATLSPHHKHIGVIMLVGVCMGMGYLLRVKGVLLKVLIVALILVMFTVPLFGGTRTYLLGFVGVIPALVYIGRLNLVFPAILIVLGSLIFLEWGGNQVTERIEAKLEKRVTSRIERFGYEGLYRERTIIYLDILRAIREHPYLLITGTGYQNIFSFIRANGAHNNYLQALMELGIAGLVVFIAFIASLWKNLTNSIRVPDRDISIMSQYIWVALCGIIMTMFVGETYWGQASMFTLAGQLSFLFAIAVSPLYWINRYRRLFTKHIEQ